MYSKIIKIVEFFFKITKKKHISLQISFVHSDASACTTENLDVGWVIIESRSHMINDIVGLTVLCTIIDFLYAQDQLYIYKPISQIPQCNRWISHNAPFCNTNVHISHFCYKMVHCGICEMDPLTHWGRVSGDAYMHRQTGLSRGLH